ncbi:uncharacterized protein MYCFIDRAFT_36301 [Pseudocercospora fijiensis CIRAD86]|uniref:PDZ GRASP-type domain-containing protein n=1 Tax=Pseudocercospora fijiensis (strain CIRAD86) TaxID=383855 RepID=M3AZR8_PSEFD|nr:uncharacterized protein MYCFIDRAFT_36301 [Pseudocercospora fijiensis CIRAD86]EME82663.1 hypothetical protein MYCFIDRAFT_36301 [Pseudocercospora fijiensis CIRAD86]
MFGALNRFISRLDSDPNAVAGARSQSSSGGHYGFQILRNTNSQIPLEPWFDFIIGINGHNIENPDPNLFVTELKNCAGSTVSLGIFGAKGSQIREIYITVPNLAAGEALGLALQWAPLAMADDVWHILDVMPNSPADVAGLLPYSDYVIGSPDAPALAGDAALGRIVEAYMDAPLRLWVYNNEYDVTRMLTITPARNWGGDGALGCVLGYGALHRIPAPLTEPSTGPGETMFESNEKDAPAYQAPMSADAGDAPPAQGGGFLVPANMANFTAPAPSKGPPAGKARKARAHHAPAAGLDDYFAEGEQKSRELEGNTTSKTSGLPPPPKSGGPPKAGTPLPPKADEAKEADEA